MQYLKIQQKEDEKGVRNWQIFKGKNSPNLATDVNTSIIKKIMKIYSQISKIYARYVADVFLKTRDNN